jgi:hypothetical protein
MEEGQQVAGASRMQQAQGYQPGPGLLQQHTTLASTHMNQAAAFYMRHVNSMLLLLWCCAAGVCWCLQALATTVSWACSCAHVGSCTSRVRCARCSAVFGSGLHIASPVGPDLQLCSELSIGVLVTCSRQLLWFAKPAAFHKHCCCCCCRW